MVVYDKIRLRKQGRFYAVFTRWMISVNQNICFFPLIVYISKLCLHLLLHLQWSKPKLCRSSHVKQTARLLLPAREMSWCWCEKSCRKATCNPCDKVKVSKVLHGQPGPLQIYHLAQILATVKTVWWDTWYSTEIHHNSGRPDLIYPIKNCCGCDCWCYSPDCAKCSLYVELHSPPQTPTCGTMKNWTKLNWVEK